MENKIKNSTNKFHSVDFMREVRSELTEQLLQDKKNILIF